MEQKNRAIELETQDIIFLHFMFFTISNIVYLRETFLFTLCVFYNTKNIG